MPVHLVGNKEKPSHSVDPKKIQKTETPKRKLSFGEVTDIVPFHENQIVEYTARDLKM